MQSSAEGTQPAEDMNLENNILHEENGCQLVPTVMDTESLRFILEVKCFSETK